MGTFKDLLACSSLDHLVILVCFALVIEFSEAQKRTCGEEVLAQSIETDIVEVLGMAVK